MSHNIEDAKLRNPQPSEGSYSHQQWGGHYDLEQSRVIRDISCGHYISPRGHSHPMKKLVTNGDSSQALLPRKSESQGDSPPHSPPETGSSVTFTMSIRQSFSKVARLINPMLLPHVGRGRFFSKNTSPQRKRFTSYVSTPSGY